VRIAYQKQMIKKWEGDLRPPKGTGANKPVFDFNLNKIILDA